MILTIGTRVIYAPYLLTLKEGTYDAWQNEYTHVGWQDGKNWMKMAESQLTIVVHAICDVIGTASNKAQFHG